MIRNVSLSLSSWNPPSIFFLIVISHPAPGALLRFSQETTTHTEDRHKRNMYSPHIMNPRGAQRIVNRLNDLAPAIRSLDPFVDVAVDIAGPPPSRNSRVIAGLLLSTAEFRSTIFIDLLALLGEALGMQFDLASLSRYVAANGPFTHDSLAPLSSFLTRQGVLKVTHQSRGLCMAMSHIIGVRVTPLIDVGIYALLCGVCGEQPCITRVQRIPNLAKVCELLGIFIFTAVDATLAVKLEMDSIAAQMKKGMLHAVQCTSRYVDLQEQFVVTDLDELHRRFVPVAALWEPQPLWLRCRICKILNPQDVLHNGSCHICNARQLPCDSYRRGRCFKYNCEFRHDPTTLIPPVTTATTCSVEELVGNIASALAESRGTQNVTHAPPPVPVIQAAAPVLAHSVSYGAPSMRPVPPQVAAASPAVVDPAIVAASSAKGSSPVDRTSGADFATPAKGTSPLAPSSSQASSSPPDDKGGKEVAGAAATGATPGGDSADRRSPTIATPTPSARPPAAAASPGSAQSSPYVVNPTGEYVRSALQPMMIGPELLASATRGRPLVEASADLCRLIGEKVAAGSNRALFVPPAVEPCRGFFSPRGCAEGQRCAFSHQSLPLFIPVPVVVDEATIPPSHRSSAFIPCPRQFLYGYCSIERAGCAFLHLPPGPLPQLPLPPMLNPQVFPTPAMSLIPRFPPHFYDEPQRELPVHFHTTQHQLQQHFQQTNPNLQHQPLPPHQAQRPGLALAKAPVAAAPKAKVKGKAAAGVAAQPAATSPGKGKSDASLPAGGASADDNSEANKKPEDEETLAKQQEGHSGANPSAVEASPSPDPHRQVAEEAPPQVPPPSSQKPQPEADAEKELSAAQDSQAIPANIEKGEEEVEQAPSHSQSQGL